MSKNNTSDIRWACVQLMRELQTQGGSLTRLLPLAQAKVAESERAQLQAWAYGFARFSGELRGFVDQLLDKALKPKDLDVYLLMQLGIYQLRHSSVAEHAAVDETVKVLRRIKKPWAKGLVNAVLRNYLRRTDELELALTESQRWNHPDWLMQRLQTDWPDGWKNICRANNAQAPMTLRVNHQKLTTAAYQKQLEEQGLNSSTIAAVPTALQLESPVAVQKLPQFADGLVSVQDAAAQLAASELIRHAPAGGRFLDACSAPGGKTALVLEQAVFTGVTALDKDAERLQRVSETLDRLGLGSEGVNMIACDATALDQWWDGKAYDAVLLDAPCSGTGVIRRHPDIKLLRWDTDIANLAELQGRLLDALWKTVAEKGILLYATCSVLKEENEQQVAAFLERTPNAHLADTERQILPGEQGMDGFYYAPLIKRNQ